MTASEVVQSLTGYEEIAIEKALGKPIEHLGTESGLLRALAYVTEKRGGSSESDAKRRALSLTRKELETYFSDDEDEVMPDEPVTDSGKPSSSSASAPRS